MLMLPLALPALSTPVTFANGQVGQAGWLRACLPTTPARYWYSQLNPAWLPRWGQQARHSLQQPLTPQQLQTARPLLALWQSYGGFSAFNAPTHPLPPLWHHALAQPSPCNVVLMDEPPPIAPEQHQQALQHAHDLLANVKEAYADQPNLRFWLKPHPLTPANGQGILAQAWASLPHAPVLHPLPVASCTPTVCAQASTIVTLSSHVGVEALLLETPVWCSPLAWYGGLGYTHHTVQVRPPKPTPLQLATLFYVAYVAGCVYHNPHTSQPASLASTLDVLHHQRQHVRKHPGPKVVLGKGLWDMARHLHCKPFLEATGQPIAWVTSSHQALQALHSHPQSSLVLEWPAASYFHYLNSQRQTTALAQGIKPKPLVTTLAQQANRPIVTMEDGFLRSVGLASEMGRPASLCIDEQGIHFNTSPPSDLETLLQTTTFTPHDLERASQLRQLICDNELSKYNMQGSTIVNPMPLPHTVLRLAKGKKVILTVGQVPDDASLLCGSPYLPSNIDLMVEVRRRNPDAFIIFKVHPDVVSGTRNGQDEVKHIKPLADCITQKLAMEPWLAVCDELHVLTSLSGFEGLLRGKKVVTYGHPFYAGWGLTHDIYPLPQRTRQLTLDELVAGVLIHYPTYYDWQTGLVDTPEHVAWRLAQQLKQPKSWWQTLLFGQVAPALFGAGRKLLRSKA